MFNKPTLNHKSTNLMNSCFLAILFLLTGLTGSQEEGDPRTIGAATEGMKRSDGFLPFYWDESEGKLFLEIDRFDQEFLYQTSLVTGVGSNPIGLDRGQLGASHVVEFRKIGPKVLLVATNQRYTAVSDNPAERRAVEESFAESVLYGFEVIATEDERVLVDATEFVVRDAHGIGPTLSATGQGNYSFDRSRSAVYLKSSRAFPQNTELEALLTLTIPANPGRLVRQTTPDPTAVSLRQRISLIELPSIEGDDAYQPRNSDPRVGYFTIDLADYAQPIASPIETQLIARHRLVKQDPDANRSEPVEPIVYYVDPGAPEPIRSALVEGASWWNEAFEAAGFIDAFRVEILPDDADPMDVRYNMIHWVHRSTRGWSYGSSVIDPRTGEILKGNVTLGSLRVRQDYMIGSNLSVDPTNGTGEYNDCECGLFPIADSLTDFDPETDPETMALARIRQLSAHEVGHTLGLAHNFAASTFGRASVMDYPAPLVRITDDDQIDLANAYDVGIGEYDKFAIEYGYREFQDPEDESEALKTIIEDGIDAGILYLSDGDARPAGAAHPLANLWDNGSDPISALRHELRVRELALERFSPEILDAGTPLGMLGIKLVPLFLHHRYQVTATAKTIGGVRYTYSVQTNDGPSPALVFEIEPVDRQREALSVLLETTDPRFLQLPDRLLDWIPPVPNGALGVRDEPFGSQTSPILDPITIAVTGADLTISALIQPERIGRLIDFHSRDRSNLGFEEVLDRLIAQVFAPVPSNPRQLGTISRAIQSLLVTRLLELGGNNSASAESRAIVVDRLRKLRRSLAIPGGNLAHRQFLIDEIEQFLERPAPTRRPLETPELPPGDPIGN